VFGTSIEISCPALTPLGTVISLSLCPATLAKKLCPDFKPLGTLMSNCSSPSKLERVDDDDDDDDDDSATHITAAVPRSPASTMAARRLTALPLLPPAALVMLQEGVPVSQDRCVLCREVEREEMMAG
jgi:hypothetical protein